MNIDRFATQQIAEEYGKYALIGIRQALPFAIYIEHAEGSHTEVETQISAGRRNVDIAFGSVFGYCVIRDWIDRGRFRNRVDFGITINSHRTGEEQPWYPVSDALLQDVDGAKCIDGCQVY